MQKPQGRENGGKYGFLPKATPRSETCLSLTAIMWRVAFFLTLVSNPSAAVSAPHFTECLPAVWEEALPSIGSGMARDPGSGSRARAFSAAECYAIAVSPPATRNKAAVASSQPAINTLTPAHPNSTGHQRWGTCCRKKHGSEICS